MIVDDDDNLRAVLRSILEQEGYQVSEARSGIECLDHLKAGEKPDLILLDVMMPDMDGWETSRRIKEDKDLKDNVVAMLTVKSRDKDKIKSLGFATADWHIAKPIDKKGFIKTVKWIFSGSK
jgi:two-component system chemotaxis sensor kinase CheA